MPLSFFTLLDFAAALFVVKKKLHVTALNETLPSSAVHRGRSSQHCHSTPGCPPHGCGAPQHHRGAPGPVHMCRGCSGQTKLPFQQVVSDAAVRKRSHVLLSLVYKASLSCAQEGRNVGFIWPSGAVGSLGWRKYVGVGTGAGEDRTIKKCITELYLNTSR